MATISRRNDCLTLITTFEVDPSRAEDLARLLVSAIETTMRHRDGFISASIHVAEDRKQVVNYAQWRDRAAFEAMLADPDAQVQVQMATELSEAFNPVFYRVTATVPADD